MEKPSPVTKLDWGDILEHCIVVKALGLDIKIAAEQGMIFNTKTIRARFERVFENSFGDKETQQNTDLSYKFWED